MASNTNGESSRTHTRSTSQRPATIQGFLTSITAQIQEYQSMLAQQNANQEPQAVRPASSEPIPNTESPIHQVPGSEMSVGASQDNSRGNTEEKSPSQPNTTGQTGLNTVNRSTEARPVTSSGTTPVPQPQPHSPNANQAGPLNSPPPLETPQESTTIPNSGSSSSASYNSGMRVQDSFYQNTSSSTNGSPPPPNNSNEQHQATVEEYHSSTSSNSSGTEEIQVNNHNYPFIRAYPAAQNPYADDQMWLSNQRFEQLAGGLMREMGRLRQDVTELLEFKRRYERLFWGVREI